MSSRRQERRPLRPGLRPLTALLAALLSTGAWASSSGLVISQVYGGGGSTATSPVPAYKYDFVELFNAGATAVSLSGLSLQYGSSTGNFGNSTSNVVTLPNVAVLPGQYFLVRLATATNATGADLATFDHSGNAALSATAGKVALVQSTTGLACGATATLCSDSQLAQIVDRLAYGSSSTQPEGTALGSLSTTTAALRAGAGCTDTDNNSADFSTGTPSPRSTASALNVCSGGGGGSGGGSGTPATLTPIYTIQGSGSTSALAGQVVATEGVVTKLTNTGYYLQDLTGDGNAATSDGLYVHLGAAPSVSAGQLVRVTGTVTEFNTGAATNAGTLARTVTELTGVTSTTVQGSGYSVTPVSVTLPLANDADLERYEGMRVTLQGPLTVSQNYFLGRYGQLTLSAGGRMETPTNAHRPGTAQAVQLADLNARSSIVLDDGTSAQNPNPTPYLAADSTVRAGDTVASVTGVLDYGLATADNTGLSDWKIHPSSAPVFTRVNTRSTQPLAVGGTVKVASFNVLNYFTTFTNGSNAAGQTGQGCTLDGATSAANCRGASNATEFTRQRDKIIAALAAIDADVVGLMEMQNNGSTAVGNLVSGLNAVVGAGTYAAVSDPASGTGTDAIKVAMIYKPARLSPAAGALSDTDSTHNRPPLAQVFSQANGEKLAVVVNHFKSKGSCPVSGDADYAGNFDSGDGQGCWNARRLAQAQRLRSWLSTAVVPSTGQVLLLGDFNAYAQEDPIHSLTSDGAYVDQIGRYNSFGYSYVFDGAAGRLDHALAAAALSPKVTRAVEWHINADEPLVLDYNQEFRQPACATCGPDYYSATAYRSSDHDPVVMGLDLRKAVVGTTGRDTLTGTAGDDRITGGAGADTVTTGAGRDVVVYTSLRDVGDVVTDFAPGADQLDLSALLASVGWTGTGDPVAQGVVSFSASGANTVVKVSASGAAGGSMRVVATLQNLSPALLDSAHDLIVRSSGYGVLSSARYRKVRL